MGKKKVFRTIASGNVLSTDWVEVWRAGVDSPLEATIDSLFASLGNTTAMAGFTIPSGSITLTSGNLTLTSGGLTMTSGNVTHTAGNHTMSDGVLSVTETSASTTMGTVRAIVGQITGSATAIASGNIVGVRGLCTLSGTITAGGAYLYGTQGKLIVTGTMNHADSRLCAMLAQLDGTGGTFTAGQLSGLWIDILGITGAGGDNQFFPIRITCSNGATPHAILYAQSDATYFLELGHPTGDTTSYFAAAGTGGGSAGASGGAVATHVLKVNVDGTDYWVPLCNTNS